MFSSFSGRVSRPLRERQRIPTRFFARHWPLRRNGHPPRPSIARPLRARARLKNLMRSGAEVVVQFDYVGYGEGARGLGSSSVASALGGELSLSLTEKEIRTRLLKAVGKQVKFDYPGGIGNKRGRLKDRVIVWSGGDGQSDAVYWDVVDLIEFPDAKDKDWIRIGYYRQVGDRLRWASQTTITEPCHTMKRVFACAAKEKKWFRDLLP